MTGSGATYTQFRPCARRLIQCHRAWNSVRDAPQPFLHDFESPPGSSKASRDFTAMQAINLSDAARNKLANRISGAMFIRIWIPP